MSDLTNEQIEQYREIVKNAPHDASNYHCEFKKYYGGTNARNLNDLRTIIAQHDRIAELERERDEIAKLVYNYCIGDVAMSIRIDANELAEGVYSIIGLDAEQLRKGGEHE